MATRKIPRWTGTAVLIGIGVVAVVLFLVAWLSANQIRSDLLVPVADDRPYDIEVVRNPGAPRDRRNRRPGPRRNVGF